MQEFDRKLHPICNAIKHNLLMGVAILLAVAAGAMFVIPFSPKYWNEPFDFERYGAFVGGTAGPLGSLAGFLFIIISYRVQNRNFNIQSFDQILTRLLEYHENLSSIFFFEKGLHDAVTTLKDKISKENLDHTFEAMVRSNQLTYIEFHGKFRYLIKWIKTLTAILVHIDNNRKLGIADDREKMVLNLMSKEEVRSLFYYYCLHDIEFSLVEKKIIWRFLTKMSPESLINTNHIYWLSFVKPVETPKLNGI